MTESPWIAGPPDLLSIHLGRADAPLMSASTVDACLALVASSDLTGVDLDGPPPELHPRFREIVILVRALRRRIVHRCNLLVAVRDEDGGESLPELLAEHRVDVVAALPSPSASSAVVRATRQALDRFNAVGYGVKGSGLHLDLVVPESALADMVLAESLSHARVHPVPESGQFSRDQSLASSIAELQRLSGLIHPAEILGWSCRSALVVDPQGDLSLRVLGQPGELPLARNVCDTESLDDAVALGAMPTRSLPDVAVLTSEISG